jgi:Flp pilus assembly protein TadG
MKFTRLSRLRGERGQSLIEFALVVPIFFLLIMGIVDLGHALHDYVVLENAAREGARYGSRYAWVDDTEIQTIVRNEAGANGLDVALITVGVSYPSSAYPIAGRPIRVTAQYVMNTILGSMIGRATITIGTVTEMVIFAATP